MTRKPETVGFWEGRLPHWEVVEGRYFVTLHQAGAIPRPGQLKIERLRQEFNTVPETQHDQLKRKIFAELESWLDRAPAVRDLHQPNIAQHLRDAIQHRAETGVWVAREYVIMPNHLHLFVEILRGTLKAAMLDFKKWTGKQALAMLDTPRRPFWQREWFDHWSRSDEEDQKILDYIKRNPVKAGLVSQPEDWPYGSWSQ